MAENSELSFSRKYRPSTIDGYIGNTKIKETFKRIMARGKRPQSILLTGNTGCGKTTFARIIESWYMCENPNEDGSPCGECQTCLAMKDYIETGNDEMLPDIKEIDATMNSGKADFSAILEELDYPAYGGGWKIYMIDECHKLSKSGASSLLLKPLEEPPENVLFIFCTTNPEQMLDTLINRCQLKFNVSKPTTSELCGYLKNVCLDQGKDYDMNGLRMICSKADYVIRDSLQYLETVVNSQGDATGNSVSQELQEVSDSLVYDFYKAYKEKDYMGYVRIMYTIRTTFNFSQFLVTLSSFTLRGIYVINGINVEGLSDYEINSYKDVFSDFSISDLSFILSSLKRMSQGDIEANLMSFIYSENTTSSAETPEVSVKALPLQSEAKFRNSNTKILENAKLSKGVKSLESQMEAVSVDDIPENLFNLEKIE